MPNLKQFKLPDLGEGLTEGEILQWLVAPGDVVKLNQPIVEVETAKAAVEVPSPYAGRVTELHFDAGSTVDVGAPIITFDVGGDTGGSVGVPDGADIGVDVAARAARAQAVGAAANPAESATAAASAAAQQPMEVTGVPAALVSHPPIDDAVEPGLIGGPAPGGRTSVLVGYGPRVTSARRRPRKPEAGAAAVAAPGGGPAVPTAEGSAVAAAGGSADAGRVAALAKPPVRKLARDLGVELLAVQGSGPGGIITRADVEAAAGGHEHPATAAGAGRARGAASDDFDPVTRELRIPVSGVRKHTAEAMVRSAFTAPHVTEFVTVDVTPTMDLIERLKAHPDFDGVKVSPLLLVAKALMLSCRRNPGVNASWDDDRREIVLKGYVNLGIAAATGRGLVVPNIKDADRLSLPDLARSITELTQTARAGKTSVSDMQHGTITITNVGVFGIDTGTPIINPGEAAILCLGAIRQQPWVVDGVLAVRWVTTLGLSFDHRLIDGQLGSQFLADIAGMLSDPASVVLYV